MENSKAVSTLVITITALLVNVHCTLEPGEPARCDYIYNTWVFVRTNIIENPTIIELYGEDVLDALRQGEAFLGISFDDEEDIRRFSCDIADASTMSELAALLNFDDPESFRQVLVVYSMVDGDQFIQLRRELRKVQPSVKKSGFPDEWPLNVTKEETKILLDNTPELGLDFIYFSWNKDTKTVADFLTASSSLREYLEKMELDHLIDDPNRLEEKLKPARALKSRRAMKIFIRASEAYYKVFIAIKELKFAFLP